VLYLALKPLGAAEMLEPTLARLLSPIPRAALPSWTACQHELYEVLGLHGTDRAALATARVLRACLVRIRVGFRRPEIGFP
jgi:hypothetical protein